VNYVTRIFSTHRRAWVGYTSKGKLVRSRAHATIYSSPSAAERAGIACTAHSDDWWVVIPYLKNK
jgi:hypothetical protein